MKYKRIVVRQYGGPEVLEVEEVEARNPVARECRVRVKAAGINRADSMMRRGMYPPAQPACPFTPGREVSGVVDCVGDGVTRFKGGEPVIALIKYGDGGYSEYVYLPETELVPTPTTLDFAETASLPLNFITAYQMVHRHANLSSGKRMLVHGASGGVGSALLQLGALAKYEMIGVGSREKHDLIARLGATPLDYRTQDFVKFVHSLPNPGVDVVFDPIGGSHIWQSFCTLRPGGKVIVFGEQSYAGGQKTNKTERFTHHFLLRWLNYWPSTEVMFFELEAAGPHGEQEEYLQDLRTLVDLLDKGSIKPMIAAKFPLDEVNRAHQIFDAGGVAGRLVLIMDG